MHIPFFLWQENMIDTSLLAQFILATDGDASFGVFIYDPSLGPPFIQTGFYAGNPNYQSYTPSFTYRVAAYRIDGEIMR